MGPDGETLFAKLQFTQFMNQNVRILGKRLYSPSLKNVAWQKDAQLICLIIYFSINLPVKFDWVDGRIHAVRGEQIADRCMEN